MVFYDLPFDAPNEDMAGLAPLPFPYLSCETFPMVLPMS
jgi:hypothetical protein